MKQSEIERQYRRLNYYCTLCWAVWQNWRNKEEFDIDTQLAYFEETAKGMADRYTTADIAKRIPQLEMYRLFKQLEFTNEEALAYWKTVRATRKTRREQLRTKPNTPRKDNNGWHTVGSGSGGSNKIRYPKKCRKTAWKRFYKLFPKLDPNRERVPFEMGKTFEVQKILGELNDPKQKIRKRKNFM